MVSKNESKFYLTDNLHFDWALHQSKMLQETMQ